MDLVTLVQWINVTRSIHQRKTDKLTIDIEPQTRDYSRFRKYKPAHSAANNAAANTMGHPLRDSAPRNPVALDTGGAALMNP